MPNLKRKANIMFIGQNKRHRSVARSFRPSGESKHFNGLWDETSFTHTGAILKMSDIAEGSDNVNRIGRKCNSTKLEVHLNVHIGGAYAVPIRMVGLKLKGKYTGSLTDYLSAYNSTPNSDKAYTFYDHIDYVTSERPVFNLNRTFKVSNTLKYMGTGATDDQDGAIVFILMSLDVTTDPVYSGSSRLFFHDV